MEVFADSFMQTASNYICIPMGIDKLRFTLPTQYDGVVNEGIENGYVYVNVDNGGEQLLFEWRCDDYTSLDKGYWIKAYQGGTFQLAGKAKALTTFTSSNDWVKYYLNADDNDKDHRTTTVDWVIPHELRGKNLKITLWAHVNQYTLGDWHIPDANSRLLMLDWDAPEAVTTEVELADFMLAYDQKQVGKIMSVYSINAKSVNWAKLHYTDAVMGTQGTIDLEKKLVGFAYLPMDRPYTNVYVEASVIDTENHETVVSSAPKNTPMVHIPTNFHIEMTPEGHALLSWRVVYPQQEDMDIFDQFEIQRNVNGAKMASGWQSCGSLSFEEGKETYTFEDPDLIEIFNGSPVAYRVRRTSTGIWSWSDGAGGVTSEMSTIPVLPQIDEATVQRSATWNEEIHIANFTFSYGPDYDADGNYIIRSAQGFETFAQRVNNGETAINAIMASDINLGNSQVMVGTQAHPYIGTFNGNGHTLTINYDNTIEAVAPFSYIGDATIKNLHVDGSATSTSKFVGGLAGRVVGNQSTKIDNCRISVSVGSGVDGDATNGGIVALAVTGKLLISNSRFDGQLLGEKCYNNGGIVGWTEAECMTEMINCLFAPSKITTKYDGCKTFSRCRNYNNLKLTNCIYTVFYDMDEKITIEGKEFYILRSNSDWLKFRDRVKSAKQNSDVNAIMVADLSVTDAIGLEEDARYRGTFDGNGHTLNVNIAGEGKSYMAPFSLTSGATIKNLRLMGFVLGGIHSSGLIGRPSQGSTTRIENVRVSVSVTCSGNNTNGPHSGGFIGHNGNATLSIINCLFDGTLISKTINDSYAGAFVGWGEGTWTFDQNYENGTYVNTSHTGMCYHNAAAWGGSATNYSIHDWPEMKTDANRNATNAAKVVPLLGNQWKLEENTALPIMHVMEVGQGSNAGNKNSTELAKALGSQWATDGGEVVPVLEKNTKGIYSPSIWDPRAKLFLRVNMHGENETSNLLIDLSNNEEVFKTHQFTQELTRNCVEYSFDLITIRGTSPMKIMGSDKDTIMVAVKKIDAGDLANYRFLNTDTIRAIHSNKKQSSVELTWETSGGDHDFFRLLRKDKINLEAQWDTIAPNLSTLYYEDKTVLAQHTYLYRVESVFQCEGTHKSSKEVEGCCEITGMINGYVRLADGTAMAGVTVRVEPADDDTRSVATQPFWEAVSDSTGYYEVKGLPYRERGRYSVYIPVSGISSSFSGGGTIEFTTSSNWIQNFNLYQDDYVVYSGNVYYRDTSIPVPGVSFLLDGKTIYNANRQPIETDTQGAFELSIPRGPHCVQAVKKGHYFASKGFLIDENRTDSIYNFTKNVPSVYIWDSTTVVLRGRVVGGDVQGDLPLGKSLSKNNLGDSLKIVMQLEGDNTSWLIRKQNDETVKSAKYDVCFGENNKNVTHVNVTRHTLTIRPDSLTGEYQLELPPAKYKVIEISAQGYATLFQTGKVGETIDLSFKQEGDTCEYNRIYHSAPDVDIRQVNGGSERYFGFKTYTASNNIGEQEEVTVWYKDEAGVGHYSFGYPVFMAQSPYGWILQACEKYHYNNNLDSAPEIVNLNGGTIQIQNALTTDPKTSSCEVKLDETGAGQYVFIPNNTSFTMENDNALKTVSITLEYDGSYYDIKPFNKGLLKGYVMAVKPEKEGQYTEAIGVPQLVDILRDPPGGGSSSYIETGSKMSCSYSLNLDASLGVKFTNQTINSKATILKGVVVAPGGSGDFSGTEYGSDVRTDFVVSIVVNYTGSWNWSYNYDVSERIQTSNSKKWIGGKADLFIGHNENIILYKAIAVRAIPEKQYLMMKSHEGGTFEFTDEEGNKTKVKVPVGTMKMLAKGTDQNGKPIYLVRDEVIAAGPKVKSTFVHSQNYIENELIPSLMKLRNSLLYPSNSNIDFQALADKNDKVYYESLLPVTDPMFGSDSEKAYKVYYPSSSEKVHSDSIKALNQEMYIWLNYLSLNEMEKLNVTPDRLVKNYDFDGAANIQYSENFSVSRTDAGQVKYPLIQSNDLMSTFPSLFSTFKDLENLNKIERFSEDPKPQEASIREGNNNTKTINWAVGGKGCVLKWTPIVAYNINGKNTQAETYTKKVGFTLSAASKSNLNVDVYRTRKNYWDINSTNDELDKENHVKPDTILFLTKDNLSMQHMGNTYQPVYSNWTVYSNFVFRTRGGVTCQPFEDARSTKWYHPGTVLDVATVPADRPKVWIDQPVVSNVPFGEPAHFTIHFANESDYPDRATMVFNYYLLASSNPKGAKVCVDGKTLGSGGENITLYPVIGSNGNPNVFTKEVTVYPSTAYDYEDLTICFYDPEDASRTFSTKFSAHFIPSAGNVNISTPGDHWVVNTESPYDGKRKAWYMPVRIDGFNVNFPGFDHIELQYKLSTQGEKDWVSTCAYYADEALRKKASGVTDTIPSNGIIIAPFYGEKDPIEQYYDLRAVNYCRHAGGFLTRSSEILSGIKDTRLPEIFGTPEPVDGILNYGEDIKLSFSEPIAGNYLSKINNFELLGTPINNDISTSTSLNFDGGVAISEGKRNLAEKNFTVDIMLNPVDNNEDMVVFLHGPDEERRITLGLSADRHLTATLNGQTVMSDSIVPFKNIMRQVAYAIDQSGENLKVNFFDGSELIGTKELPGKHKISASIVLGANYFEEEGSFSGDMLEFRLWNRAMTGPQLSSYARKHLSGYENGLIDYYPMNEGKGSYCYDKAPGSMDLQIYDLKWKLPAGISMKLNGTEGIKLNPKPFERTEDHDYTLMFWFRTKDANATLFSNGKAKTADDTDKINIGVSDNSLYVRSSGYERPLSNVISDGKWHHFAMTVSRSRNVANIYVDLKQMESFAADSLSGIIGDHIALGATYVDKNTPTNVLTGNIDEVGLFESVLPIHLISKFSTETPIGTMASMLAYLDFGKSERQDNNTMRLEPTGISLKRYKDSQGNVLERQDTLIAVIDERFVDRVNQAPITNIAQLDNLNFNFMTDGQNLLVDIKEPDFLLEKTNVYLTVKEVADLQGNLMASPVTTNIYIYRNPLRWNVKSIKRDVPYGKGLTFEATIKNMSGERQEFQFNDLPVWISVSQTSGVINALDEQTITFTISPYTNIGTYKEQINLIAGNGMSEPLSVTLNVRGNEPAWAVSEKLLQLNQTMMMVCRIKMQGMVVNSPEDIVGVFDDDLQTLCVSHIEVDQTANSNEALAYLTIFGYTNADGSKPHLNFKLYKASTGKVYPLEEENEKEFTFEKDAVIGTASNPVVMNTMYFDVQTIRLKKGWNWVSFYTKPFPSPTVKQFFDDNSMWEVGDIVMTVNGTETQQWSCRPDKKSPRGYKWDYENEEIYLFTDKMYYIYSCSDKMVSFQGLFDYPMITVQKGWNRIAYQTDVNLPVGQALNDYADQATEGDIIKSQEGFAVASRTSSGLVWKGTLQFMETGKGYMLKRQNEGIARFFYPWYYSDNRYDGSFNHAQHLPEVTTVNTMNIVASVSGVEIEPDDKLVIYSGADRMTEAQADDEQLFYLNIGCDEKLEQSLTFIIERDGKVLATTDSHINYEPNQLLGTPNQPTEINFVPLSDMPNDGKWYTISGMQLSRKPSASGLYIHNGQVITVK